MKREFNDTGLCVHHMHYMADTSRQMNEIFEKLIEKGKYFTINRGRQFGKTTTISLLAEMLEKHDDYLLIETSFEGIGDDVFKEQSELSKFIVEIIADNLKYKGDEYSTKVYEKIREIDSFKTLSLFIADFVKEYNKKVILTIGCLSICQPRLL